MAFAELKFKGAAALNMVKTIEDKIVAVKSKNRAWIGIVGSFAFADVINHFSQEKGPSGKWAAWSKLYAADAAKRGQSRKLQDTGRLRQSTVIAYKSSSSDQDAILVNAAKVNNFPYAFAHNEGGEQLPKREYMWLSSQAMNKITNATMKFILK